MATTPFATSREERRVAVSRHLLPVVEALASEGVPYNDLSVERIIKAGGISRSAFYKYFDDKVDLLVAMAHEAIADLIETGAAWWRIPPDGGREDLRRALRVPLDSYRSRHMILGAVVETATYDARVREQQRLLIDTVSRALADHVRTGQADGTVDDSLDADRTARWVVWMLERGLYQLVTPADPKEADLLLDAVTDVVWRVFYAGFREA